MYEINKEAFRRYFFWGINNPEELLEGIMYFIYENDLFKYAQIKGKMTEKEIREAFIQRIKPLYKQYYRFVELNNKSQVLDYAQEDEKELEERIRNKIEILRNTGGEEITQEQIQNEVLKEKQAYERIYEQNKEHWSEEDKVKWTRESIQKVAKTRRELEERARKILIIKDNDISYSRAQRFKYAILPEGSITKEENQGKYIEYATYKKEDWNKKQIPNDLETWGEEPKNQQQNSNERIPDKLRHWTQVVSEILKTLDKVEKEDPKAYKDLWLRTRQNRAKNGTIPEISKEEIDWLDNACEELRKERLQEEKESKGEPEIE